MENLNSNDDNETNIKGLLKLFGGGGLIGASKHLKDEISDDILASVDKFYRNKPDATWKVDLLLNRTNSIKDILEASKKAQKAIKENGTKPEYYQALRDGTASTIKFLRKNKTPDLYDLKHSFFKGHNAAFKKSMLPMNILKGLGAASLLGGGGYLTYSGIKDLVKESGMVKKAEALPFSPAAFKFMGGSEGTMRDALLNPNLSQEAIDEISDAYKTLTRVYPHILPNVNNQFSRASRAFNNLNKVTYADVPLKSGLRYLQLYFPHEQSRRFWNTAGFAYEPTEANKKAVVNLMKYTPSELYSLSLSDSSLGEVFKGVKRKQGGYIDELNFVKKELSKPINIISKADATLDDLGTAYKFALGDNEPLWSGKISENWKDFLIKPKEVINNVKPIATEPPIVAGRKVTSTIKNIFKGLAGTRYIKPFMLGGLGATALGGGGAYLYNKEKETGYVADLIQQLRNKLNS